MCSEMFELSSVGNKDDKKVGNKDDKKIITKISKCIKKVNIDKFDRFLKMNAYDLALEDHFRAYNFLLKEVMDGFEGSVKEKQEFFNLLLMKVIEFLEKNGYLEVAKNLSNYYKTQIMKKVKMKNNEIRKKVQSSINVEIKEFFVNVVEREYLYDFENWLKVKENRTLLNFVYSYWVDGLEEEAKTFLKEQIYQEKEREQERKEILLKNAINYLKLLIKREIGNI